MFAPKLHCGIGRILDGLIWAPCVVLLLDLQADMPRTSHEVDIADAGLGIGLSATAVLGVLRSAHDAQVRWLNAGAIEANVIDLHAGRDGASR